MLTSVEQRISIVGIQPARTGDWEDAQRASPPATFFATTSWAAACAAAFPGLLSSPVRVGFSDGMECILPLMRSRSRLRLNEYAGMPLGSYTALLPATDGELVPAHYQSLVRALGSIGDKVALTLWPLDPGLPPAADRCFSTAAVDLTAGFEAVVAGWDGRARRMAGQAFRRGVTCEIDRSSDAVGAYYALLCDASERWGLDKPAIPAALFEALHGSPDVEFWFAKLDNQVIAGGVIFYGRSEAFFFSAAMRAEFGTMRPSNALNHAMMQQACARGIRWYNLGASEGLPGVERFKRGLGADLIAYGTHRSQSARSAFMQRAKQLLRVRAS